jgi:hypothetical protein
VTTALDRYRAAKLALDTFDAFSKGMLSIQVPPPNHYSSTPNVSTEASLTWRHGNSTAQQNVGFNRFVARWNLREREGLAAEYRETLVVAVLAAKGEAEAEARAVLREVAPT